MLNVEQFRSLVVRPVLTQMGHFFPPYKSEAAENLLVGTALIESDLSWLRQTGFGGNYSRGGLGLYQIEAATHDDCWNNFLKARPDHAHLVRSFGSAPGPAAPELITNLAYATAIARIIYWRKPARLPDADDIEGLGQYWKDHYNTRLGKGNPSSFVERYLKHEG